MNQYLTLINPIEKHDIVSVSCRKILTSQDNISPNYSLRTYSVDMSLPKWLKNNGLSLKMVRSSYELQAALEQDCHDINDIWSPIQADNRSWGCILSPTKNDGQDIGLLSDQLPPPYVHPMEKRSSSLSDKSLEICTENLGSETGSDGILCSSLEHEQAGKEHNECKRAEKEKAKEGENQMVEVNASSIMGNSNRMRMSMLIPPSFPPPIPSLGKRGDGTNLRIRSHREDGRLVVEAVSMPCRNCFRAERQDGRLLLTLLQERDEDVEARKSKEQGETKSGIVRKDYDDRLINVAKKLKLWPSLSIVRIRKLIKKATWERNYKTDDESEQVKVKMSETQVLDLRTATVTIAVNAYQFYWRASSNTTTMALVWGNTYNYNIHFYAQQVGKDTKWNNNSTKEASGFKRK